jgi:hypothetical protein
MNGYSMVKKLEANIGKTVVINYRDGFESKEMVFLLKRISKASEALPHQGIEKDMPILVLSKLIKPEKDLAPEQKLVRKIFPNESAEIRIPLVSRDFTIYTVIDAESGEVILQNTIPIAFGLIDASSVRQKFYADFLSTQTSEETVIKGR